MAGAIAMFADCIDPAQSTPPAAEQRHTAPRPTPTPGTVLVLPTPEPSALADEAYSVLADLTTQYSPRESGADQELETALYPQKNLDALGYDTSLQEFGTSYTFRSSYMFYTDTPLESGKGEALLELVERCNLAP